MENKYTSSQEELQELHAAMLEMLIDIDRLCRNHNISYFLDSGSALGAIRHGGFIPWDDDLDIGMMRSDYDRFLAICQIELNEKYAVQMHENEPLYWKPHAKIRKLNTFYPQRYTVNFKHQGLQIDIFPFDYVGDDFETANKRANRVRKLRWLNDLSLSSGYSENPIKNIALQLYKIASKNWIMQLHDWYCKRLNNKVHKYVTSYTYTMSKKKNHIFKTEDILPTKDVEFAGKGKFMIMNNPDAYLKIMYGDYMQLPPVEQREPHIYGKIIFDVAKGV